MPCVPVSVSLTFCKRHGEDVSSPYTGLLNTSTIAEDLIVNALPMRISVQAIRFHGAQCRIGWLCRHPSYFVGLLLKEARLPYSNYGHVVLAKPSPILFYPISSIEVSLQLLLGTISLLNMTLVLRAASTPLFGHLHGSSVHDCLLRNRQAASVLHLLHVRQFAQGLPCHGF